jgi:hypothetical protein
MDTYTLITVEELNANHIFSFSGPNNLNWTPMVMVMLITMLGMLRAGFVQGWTQFFTKTD